MKRCAVLFLLALFAACSSTDNVPDARDRGSYGRPPMRRASDDGGLDLAPPADWWRDPRLNEAVKLTADEVAALDKISAEHTAAIDDLRRVSATAAHDLRVALNADPVAESDIAAAGSRLRTARDQMLDHQLRMLAAERAVLTHVQWDALTDQLQAERENRRGGRDYPGRGGRYPGRGGRWPGGGGRWP